MRLTIIGDQSHPIILTITNAILGQDESSGLRYVSCHSALHIGEALFLEIAKTRSASLMSWPVLLRQDGVDHPLGQVGLTVRCISVRIKCFHDTFPNLVDYWLRRLAVFPPRVYGSGL